MASNSHSHDAPHVGTEDEKRHILGDIIAHILIGSWMLLMAGGIVARTSKYQLLHFWRSSRASVLLLPISGIAFWAFLTVYQLVIIAARGIAKSTWIDHLKMTFILSCSFLIQYAHMKKYLREAFWILSEPLALCTIATMFGFMHSQHEQSGAAYHRLGAYAYMLLALVRLAELWYSSVVAKKSSNPHSDLNPIFSSTESRKTPLPFMSAFLYLLGGVWMIDIAVTPYIRPYLLVEYNTDELLMTFCAQRMIIFIVSLFFLLAMAMVCFRMFDVMYRTTSLSIALRTSEAITREQLLHEL